MVATPIGYYDMTMGHKSQHYPTFRLDSADAGVFYYKMYSYESRMLDWFTNAYYDITLTPFLADYTVLFENGTKAIPNDGTDGTNMTDALGEPTLTVGSGLDDFSYTGPWTGTGAWGYEVRIYANGTPDTFEFRYHDGSAWSGWDDNGAAGYACAVSPGTSFSSEGLKAIFAATTGHTIGDTWTFYVWDAGGYQLTVYETAQGTGTIYPSTSASNQRTLARSVKPFRHYSDWLPYHGPMYSTSLYTPGVSYYDDLTVDGNLEARFGHPFFQDVQWEVQCDGVGTPNTYRWRANAGGSSYGTGISDMWLAPGQNLENAWSATGVAMSTSRTHMTAGIHLKWGHTTGHQLGDHWFFKTRRPAISVITSANNNNGLYRLANIINNGEGLALISSLAGSLGTGTDNLYDSSVAIKRVTFDETNIIKPVQGNITIIPLITHLEKHIGDRFPTSMGY
jgi:hypothetical protein